MSVCGECDDVKWGEIVLVLELSDESCALEPAQFRQVDVHEHDGEGAMIATELLEGLLTIWNMFHFLVVSLEHSRRDLGDGGVVLH